MAASKNNYETATRHPEGPLYLCLDQGGHASRALVFDGRGQLHAQAFRDIATMRRGVEVEHDPEELLRSLRDAVTDGHRNPWGSSDAALKQQGSRRNVRVLSAGNAAVAGRYRRSSPGRTRGPATGSIHIRDMSHEFIASLASCCHRTTVSVNYTGA